MTWSSWWFLWIRQQIFGSHRKRTLFIYVRIYRPLKNMLFQAKMEGKYYNSKVNSSLCCNECYHIHFDSGEEVGCTASRTLTSAPAGGKKKNVFWFPLAHKSIQRNFLNTIIKFHFPHKFLIQLLALNFSRKTHFHTYLIAVIINNILITIIIGTIINHRLFFSHE
jgi:hypothetical protein